MIAKGCTIDQIQAAILKINTDKYDGNIILKEWKPEGRRVRFTITVVHSTGKGGRLGHLLTSKGNRRHVAAACWHAHGDLFDALFKLAPDAVITAGGHKITRDYGNWEDRNIGNMMYPLYYSEACDCGMEDQSHGC